jgi:hypothetical protein
LPLNHSESSVPVIRAPSSHEPSAYGRIEFLKEERTANGRIVRARLKSTQGELLTVKMTDKLGSCERRPLKSLPGFSPRTRAEPLAPPTSLDPRRNHSRANPMKRDGFPAAKIHLEQQTDSFIREALRRSQSVRSMAQAIHTSEEVKTEKLGGTTFRWKLEKTSISRRARLG